MTDFKSSCVIDGEFDQKPARPESGLATDRQRRRRSRILDAAVDVARSGGYDLVHMPDIALRAEVSHATLYDYFPLRFMCWSRRWRAS